MEVSTDLQGRIGAKRLKSVDQTLAPGPGFVAEGFGDPPEAERPDGMPLGSIVSARDRTGTSLAAPEWPLLLETHDQDCLGEDALAI
jgi:hypothetical protein